MDVLPPADNRDSKESVLYIVDETGAGTHKTISEAMAEAIENPQRRTMITIRPQTTIENFERPSEPGGGV